MKENNEKKIKNEHEISKLIKAFPNFLDFFFNGVINFKNVKENEQESILRRNDRRLDSRDVQRHILISNRISITWLCPKRNPE